MADTHIFFLHFWIGSMWCVFFFFHFTIVVASFKSFRIAYGRWNWTVRKLFWQRSRSHDSILLERYKRPIIGKLKDFPRNQAAPSKMTLAWSVGQSSFAAALTEILNWPMAVHVNANDGRWKKANQWGLEENETEMEIKKTIFPLRTSRNFQRPSLSHVG